MDFIEESGEGEGAVGGLRTGGLAFDLGAAGKVGKQDASGSLVDVLAAVATGADERFPEFVGVDSEFFHPLG